MEEGRVQAAKGDERILYLYGVAPEEPGLRAAGDAALEVVPHLGLAGLVEAVLASEFSPKALDEKLLCLDWVTRMARKHEAVLEAAMRYGPVVPARLCTLFSGAEALKRSLAQDQVRFRSALARIRGREEWSVKVY